MVGASLQGRFAGSSGSVGEEVFFIVAAMCWASMHALLRQFEAADLVAWSRTCDDAASDADRGRAGECEADRLPVTSRRRRSHTGSRLTSGYHSSARELNRTPLQVVLAVRSLRVRFREYFSNNFSSLAALRRSAQCQSPQLALGLGESARTPSRSLITEACRVDLGVEVTSALEESALVCMDS